MIRYHDGYRALDLDAANINMQTMFYPKSWLDATGYWLNKPNLGPGVLLFDANPQAKDALTTSGEMATAVVLTAIVSSVCTLLVGGWVMRRQMVAKRHDYISINL